MIAPFAELGSVVDFGVHRVRIGGQLELLPVEGGLRPVRLPQRFWSRFPPRSDMLQTMVTRPSGVRLLARTTATSITLRVRATAVQFGDDPVAPDAFVATIAGHDDLVVRSPVTAVQHLTPSGDATGTEQLHPFSTVEFAGLPEGEKTVQLWLPQMTMIDLLGIEADAPLHPGPGRERPVWVHHGSSISHGPDLASPTWTWPAVAAEASRHEIVNLGFAGQCMLDPFVADAIADTPADLISLELGVNIVGSRATDQRTFVPAVHGFLDRIRRGHPDTPVIVVSPILWPGNEDTAGPTDVERDADGVTRFHARGTVQDVEQGAMSIALARRHLQYVVDARALDGEPISSVNGLDLYGEADAAARMLPDGLHPDAGQHRLMGERFARLAFTTDTLPSLTTSIETIRTA
ncbi:hypothetical protein C5C27_12165 [Rathayibacter sp. AY2B7]|uniref:GDSL-type esterase/lipase family protein n=1 Tax=unclassified Rathayibacter TaxID=2609250 RepID=UPI000CE889AA|nr:MULTISPECIES: SGNH/GDSL hydrolase family protein [unclassified Rathayibacter]PPG09880.1 hypothetical protein C5C26_05405 [Rathayibacter sp. AY2B1]PPG56839.1 hypothetical protein C5C27_12165 [Rathayibacter sp. AY2B7]PPG69062.1 hypothetical protein C5C59_11760 [Rathayibacter sp. AY1F4]